MPILLGFLIVCVVWAVAASVLMARDMQRRGMPVSVLWLRLMIFKYLHQYCKVTREETGHVGPLFYHYVVPLNVALAIVIVMALMGLF